MTQHFEIADTLTPTEQKFFQDLNEIIDILGIDADEMDRWFRVSSYGAINGFSAYISIHLEDACREEFRKHTEKLTQVPANIIQYLDADSNPKIKGYTKELPIALPSALVKKLKSLINRSLTKGIKAPSYFFTGAGTSIFNLSKHLLTSNDEFLGCMNFPTPEKGCGEAERSSYKQVQEFSSAVINDFDLNVIPEGTNLLSMYSKGEIPLSSIPKGKRYLHIPKEIIARFKTLNSKEIYTYAKNPFADKPNRKPHSLGSLEVPSIAAFFDVSIRNAVLTAAQGLNLGQAKIDEIEIKVDALDTSFIGANKQPKIAEKKSKTASKPAQEEENEETQSVFDRSVGHLLSDEELAPFIAELISKSKPLIDNGYNELSCSIDLANKSDNYPIALTFRNHEGDARHVSIKHTLKFFPAIIQLKQAIQTAALKINEVVPHYIKKGAIHRNEFIPSGDFKIKTAPSPLGLVAKVSFNNGGTDEITAIVPLGVESNREDSDKLLSQIEQAQQRLKVLTGEISLANKTGRTVTVYDLCKAVELEFPNSWYKPEKGEHLEGFDEKTEFSNGAVLSAVTVNRRKDINPTYVASFCAKLPNGEKINKAINPHTDDIVTADKRALEVAHNASNAIGSTNESHVRSTYVREFNASLPRYEHTVSVHVSQQTPVDGRILATLMLIRKPRKGINSITPFFELSSKGDGSVKSVTLEADIPDGEDSLELFVGAIEDDTREELKEHYSPDSSKPETRYSHARVAQCFRAAAELAANEVENCFYLAS